MPIAGLNLDSDVIKEGLGHCGTAESPTPSPYPVARAPNVRIMLRSEFGLALRAESIPGPFTGHSDVLMGSVL